MNQTGDNPKVVINAAPPGIGVGLYARSKIFPGERIATFDGPIYTAKSNEGIDPRLPNNPRDHAIQFAEMAWRDSDGFARYANHSCRPNCGIADRFDIVAIRVIDKGEEILWDYDMANDSAWAMTCRCGEDNCRGIIAGYRFLPPALRRAYRPFTSDWLLREPRAFVGHATEAWSQFPYPIIGRKQPALEDLAVYLEPGAATTKQIQAIFESLSDLHRACGGLGLEFENEGDFLLKASRVLDLV